MPNYCHNRLRIEGPDAELDKLADAVADPASLDLDRCFSFQDLDRCFSFQAIVPVEDEKLRGEAWGSTSLYSLEIDREPGELIYEFESSWDPPLAVIEALAAQWPELTIEFVFVEPGTARYGSQFFRSGALQNWFGSHGDRGHGDSDMREFLEDSWPRLAEEWWDGLDEE